MKTIITSEIIKTKISSGIEVSALVTAQVVRYEYGADADGNRGVSVVEVDWVEIYGPITSEDAEELTDEQISEATTSILDLSMVHDWEVN